MGSKVALRVFFLTILLVTPALALGQLLTKRTLTILVGLSKSTVREKSTPSSSSFG